MSTNIYLLKIGTPLLQVPNQSRPKRNHHTNDVIIMMDVEACTNEAEADDARSRCTAHALKEERHGQIAHEEGRRLKMKEGI